MKKFLVQTKDSLQVSLVLTAKLGSCNCYDGGMWRYFFFTTYSLKENMRTSLSKLSLWGCDLNCSHIKHSKEEYFCEEVLSVPMNKYTIQWGYTSRCVSVCRPTENRWKVISRGKTWWSQNKDNTPHRFLSNKVELDTIITWDKPLFVPQTRDHDYFSSETKPHSSKQKTNWIDL